MATLQDQLAVVNQRFSSSLSAAEYFAIKCAGKDAEPYRNMLAPGKYPVDVTVRLHGIVKVGQDTQASSSVTPDTAGLLAYVLSKLNSQTRDSVIAGVVEAYVENGHKMPESPPQLKAEVINMLEKLRKTETKTRAGAISGEFVVQALDRETVPEPQLSHKPLTVVG